MVAIVLIVVFIEDLFLGVLSSLEIRFHSSTSYIFYAIYFQSSSTMSASERLPC
jgi:hypothetical protein